MSDSKTGNLPLKFNKLLQMTIPLSDTAQAKYIFYKCLIGWCTSKRIKTEAKEKVILACFQVTIIEAVQAFQSFFIISSSSISINKINWIIFLNA